MQFSLILPVYNTSRFLPWCLDTCLQQGMSLGKDYEIICVNDGSTDSSPAILAEYEKKGIKVIHQKNAGVSVARNEGLKYAKGKYIWFIDSDDMIHPNSLKTIQHHCAISDADIIRIQIYRCDATTPPVTNCHTNNYNVCKVPESSQNVASNTITKRQYLIDNHISFTPGIKYGEDTLYAFALGFHKGETLMLHDYLYYYRDNPGSAMRNISRYVHARSMMMMLKSYQGYMSQYHDSPNHDIKNLRERIHWSAQNIVFDAIHCSREEFKILMREMKEIEAYPFPFLTNRLSLKQGIKPLLYGLFCFPFPIYIYAKVLNIFLGTKQK